MRFESQTHTQDDHVDRITDCSTQYGQAPAVCTRVWPKEDVLGRHMSWKISIHQIQNGRLEAIIDINMGDKNCKIATPLL